MHQLTVGDRCYLLDCGEYQGHSEKDALATTVEERWIDFKMALLDSKRKYPAQEFKKFAQAVRTYIEQSRNDPLVHRKVVQVVNGLILLKWDAIGFQTRCSKKPID